MQNFNIFAVYPKPRAEISLIPFGEKDAAATARDRSKKIVVHKVNFEAQHPRVVIEARRDIAYAQNRVTPPNSMAPWVAGIAVSLSRRSIQPSLTSASFVVQNLIEQPGKRVGAGADRVLSLRILGKRVVAGFERGQLVGNVERSQHGHAQ